MRTLETAKQYAAEARKRNAPECDCDTCRRERLLPIVMQMTKNWPMKAKQLRRVQ